MQKIRSTQLWNVKCEAIVKIYELIQNQKVKSFSNVLMQRVIELSHNIHFKIRLVSLNVLFYIISHYDANTNANGNAHANFHETKSKNKY